MTWRYSQRLLTKSALTRVVLHSRWKNAPIFQRTVFESKQCNKSSPISTLSAVLLSFESVSLQLNILCTSAVKLYYAENNNSTFMCSHAPEFVEVKTLPPGSSDRIPVNSHFWELCSKIVSSKHPIR